MPGYLSACIILVGVILLRGFNVD